ncbi:unnamed protein product [Rhizoctonia solani]|uniref:Uncharacterized protein n=1 Tax=Rhizoctonia solani TaxID=456999 RepID=A0A8H3CAQ9_9AGAM|nr:unnamed protein product [Rhizoctonia solani]
MDCVGPPIQCLRWVVLPTCNIEPRTQVALNPACLLEKGRASARLVSWLRLFLTSASRFDNPPVFPKGYSRQPKMSFKQEEEELDWGDAVDVVSLGDEDEIPCIAAVEENIGEETAPIHLAQDEDFESTAMSAKSPPAAALSHALGLSHLPPKPQSVLHRRRSRETIKASSMSRAHPRAHSPGASDDLPRCWEVRRTETVIYYYHTELRCSQLKRPTRDDARPDKFHWNGDVPPSGSDRSQPARNPPSGPAEWPERSAPDHQHRSSARERSPSRRASPPPRQRSPKPSRQRSNSVQQPAPARAMSPSSMLLPRRGASPARGLAKSSSKPQRDPDVGISNDPQDGRNGRSRDSGWEQRGRSNARERDIGRGNGRTDHYSPPPETGDSPPRRGSRNRSISPPRKPLMRSDAMVINQRGIFYCDTRRSLSPRDRDDARSYDRPAYDRMPNDARYSRECPIDLRRGGGEYHEDHFRTNNSRIPNQFPPGPEPVPPHPRDSASFSPHDENAGYPPPSGKFRDERFSGRPDNRRAQSSRTPNIRTSRVEPQDNDPRLSPVTPLNELPLPPRREFIPPGDSAHRRGRNGDIRGRMMPGDRNSMVLPPDATIDHEPISPPHVERDIHPDIRSGEHIRRRGHRRSVSDEEYMARPSLSPQATRERRLPDVSPPRHSYPNRPRDFSPQDVDEPREPDFRPRDRDPDRYPPKERREQHEPYPRGLRQEDSMSRAYDASAPHARRIAPRDAEALGPGRIYPPAEPQRPPSPVPPVREAYSRRYPRDDQFADRPPRGWDHEVEATTPSEEGPRHAGRKSQQDARRVQREAVSDTEYVEPRDEGRSRRHGGSSRFEKPEPEARPPYKRRATRDDNPPYELEDRQWTPRDAPLPLPRARSPPALMEVDSAPPVPPEKQLPGWTNFHRRRERSQERREPYRPRGRDSWRPDEDQDMEVEVIEGGKRQRIEGGTRMTQSFNHHEEDLPRKVPQHSPTQRPKIHSPVNTVVKLPQSAIVQSVDFQAAITRAKDVASQLTQANPQHRPRPKSRFDQPSDPNIIADRELLAPNGSTGFGTANASEPTVSSEANERSSPEEANDGRQGSDGSHSSHIVSRMDEASLRDSGYPQRHAGRHRDSRPDSGPSRRDRNRSENHRNGGRGNGEKPSRYIDSYRPGDDEDPGRGAGGMRAWGNPESEPQRDPPPHTSSPSTNRTYRNSDRTFARPQIVTAPEGLPPRPQTLTEYARGARNRGQTAGQVRSPSGQGGRSLITDVDTADAITDVRCLIVAGYPD